MVVQEIVALDAPMKVLTEEMDNLTVAEVIKMAAVIHHRITVIHPFGDDHVIIRTKLEKPSKIKGLALI